MAGGGGAAIARHVHDFLCSYAPAHLTSSEHTLRGYRTALSLYMEWLEGLGVTPPALASIYPQRPFSCCTGAMPWENALASRNRGSTIMAPRVSIYPHRPSFCTGARPLCEKSPLL